MQPLFTVVIPTIGRLSLPKTLESIPNDGSVEIIIVADTYNIPPTNYSWILSNSIRFKTVYLGLDAGYHDWGSPQLELGYKEAKGKWIMNCGDDDIYEPNAFNVIKNVIDKLDKPKPLMFKTILHPAPQRGNVEPVTLWNTPELINRNITGQCFVIPNDKKKIGDWNILVDFMFMTTTVEKWSGEIEWRNEIISQCY